MTDLRKILASNMKLYRKKLGISQAKLAEKANVTDNYIALIETGKRFPSVEIIERIAMVLQKDTVELFSLKYDDDRTKSALKVKILTDIDAILTIRLKEAD
ncbi:MAG: helix-turn-helix transcriptional regulator [Treponema sp.]|jgi:transcriptional regulator with XRE-family HTH domain|nr:helix-turn-helix transcriptional regulator [Treponema sp.]